MKKRGQVTLIIAVILVIILVAGLYFYIKNYNLKKAGSQTIKKKSESANSDIVIAYGEACLKKAGEDALFDVIGLHGGYVNPNGDAGYGDDGIPRNSPSPASYIGSSVPYYLDGAVSHVQSLNAIKRKLSNYIAVEFDRCFDTSVFENVGINITKPIANYRAVNFDFSRTGTNITIILNENDVFIQLDYPLTIKEDEIESHVNSIRVILPIRLKALYEGAAALAENIRNAQPDAYNITPHCYIYNKNGLTNVYLKSSDSGAREIIQLVDFSTYRERYFKSFVFQFAVRNVNVEGNCAG
ncbi:hypothetical protein HYY71_04400 [Candidatus Woesearchaeota archaeon]|nr:hypothetical protein [Candidatus Woesearchaeota archaeon]